VQAGVAANLQDNSRVCWLISSCLCRQAFPKHCTEEQAATSTVSMRSGSCCCPLPKHACGNCNHFFTVLRESYSYSLAGQLLTQTAVMWLRDIRGRII